MRNNASKQTNAAQLLYKQHHDLIVQEQTELHASWLECASRSPMSTSSTYKMSLKAYSKLISRASGPYCLVSMTWNRHRPRHKRTTRYLQTGKRYQPAVYHLETHLSTLNNKPLRESAPARIPQKQMTNAEKGTAREVRHRNILQIVT